MYLIPESYKESLTVIDPTARGTLRPCVTHIWKKPKLGPDKPGVRVILVRWTPHPVIVTIRDDRLC